MRKKTRFILPPPYEGEDFEVWEDSGTVSSLGKFEGERPWVVYLHSLSLDGFGGDEIYSGDERIAEGFYVDDDLRKLFPEDFSESDPDSFAVLFYRTDGFIHGTVLSGNEWSRYQNVYKD